MLRKLMAKKPEDRYQTSAELAAALAQPVLLEDRTYESYGTYKPQETPAIFKPPSQSNSLLAEFRHRCQARETGSAVVGP
jgi:hypothetical protein